MVIIYIIFYITSNRVTLSPCNLETLILKEDTCLLIKKCLTKMETRKRNNRNRGAGEIMPLKYKTVYHAHVNSNCLEAKCK